MKLAARKNLMILAVALVSATPLSAAETSSMGKRLGGKILLQVESAGEAWYVSPTTNGRHYLGRPADAFRVLRSEGIGITEEDLIKIPIGITASAGTDSDGDGLSDLLEDAIGSSRSRPDTDGDGYSDFAEVSSGYSPTSFGRPAVDQAFTERQHGKIFLQVEKHGEAWWVNPSDDKRYFLGRPDDAFNLMRGFGLGITNADLEKISVSAAPETMGDDSDDQDRSSTGVTDENGERFSMIMVPSMSETYSTCKDNDLDCLIEFMGDKKEIEIRVGREWTEDGIHAVSRETWRFEQTNEGHFGFSMITDERLMEMDPVMKSELLNIGTPLAELEKSEAEISELASKLTGTNNFCLTTDLGQLTDTVERWKISARSPADLDFARCCTFNESGQSEPGLACDEDFPSL